MRIPSVESSESQLAAPGPQVLVVAAPAEQRTAIRLSGRSTNPVDESWTRVLVGPRPGMAHAATSELWVRNVSQPTLQPLFPDPSRAVGSAMIVAPGGAFVGLAMDREGYAVAKWLNERGIAAFVLKYRVASTAADWQEAQRANAKLMEQLNAGLLGAQKERGLVSDLFSPQQREAMTAAREDALEALRYVRSHARQFSISANRVGMIGFSAGAMLTIDVALQADADSRPDLVAPMYGGLPAMNAVPADAPPAFLAVAADDLLLSHCLAVHEAWRANGATAELHIFENGGHGFGVLRQGKRSDEWPEVFDHWLAAHGFSQPPEE